MGDGIQFVGGDAGAHGGADRLDGLRRDPPGGADALDLVGRVHVAAGDARLLAADVLGARDAAAHGSGGGEPSGDEVAGGIPGHASIV